MISVENLCFDYPGIRALDHVSFTIEPNTITALVGPNGAGKTTLLRCLAALEDPVLGKINIEGFETDRHPRQVHEITSYLSDFYGLYDDLTVTQNLTFYALSRNVSLQQTPTSVAESLERLNLTEYKNVNAGKLSRGLRQRLAIAQTIIHKPKILLLDEPASGLDPEARFLLSKLLLSLQKEGLTLIVSSHILAELEDYSTHMLVLQKGKVVEKCSLKEIQSKEKSLNLQIDLTTEAAPYLETLKQIPNVTVKAVTGQSVIIDFTGNLNDQSALLKTMLDKQIPVRGMQEHKQRMQDVYLNIAKNNDPKSKE